MDLLLVYFGLAISSLTKGSTAIEVTINPNFTVAVGSQNVILNCTLFKLDVDRLLMLLLKARNKTTEKIEQIASFYPSDQNQEPQLTQFGQYLTDRVILKIVSGPPYKAIVIFKEILCEDDTRYICEVKYVRNAEFKSENSTQTVITVTNQPRRPEKITSSVLLSEVRGNQNVSFICTGNVGKPAGYFIWKKHQLNGSVTQYRNIETDLVEDFQNCTFFGESNLTISLSDSDNGAVVECIVQSPSSAELMSINTTKINVYYKVENVNITKNPDRATYLTGSDTYVTLDCDAEGNPTPTYRWLRAIFPNETLASSNRLTIEDLSINKSGIYVCIAENSFQGEYYNVSKSVNITIVKTDSLYRTKFASYLNTILPAVAIVIMLGIAAIGYILYREHYHNKTEELHTGENTKNTCIDHQEQGRQFPRKIEELHTEDHNLIDDNSAEDIDQFHLEGELSKEGANRDNINSSERSENCCSKIEKVDKGKYKEEHDKKSECSVKLSSEYATAIDACKPSSTLESSQYAEVDLTKDSLIKTDKPNKPKTPKNPDSSIYATVIKKNSLPGKKINSVLQQLNNC